MKILLAVPSKKRADVLAKNTLTWLKLVGEDYAIFVEPDEIIDYTKVGADRLVDIKAKDKGMAYVKNFIAEYAKAGGYDLVFKLDDDIRGFTHWREKLKTPEEVASRVRYIIGEAGRQFNKYDRVKAIAFPYSFQMFNKFEWAKTSRIQTAYIVRTDSIHPSPEVSVFEDFYTGIKIILTGGMILKYGESGIDMGVGVGKGKGGHQSFDRDAQALKEIEVIKRLYPPLKVKRVTGKNWSVEPVLDIKY